MKKYCLLLLCLSSAFISHSFANWDSLVLGSITYDSTTCTLSLVRNIGGHHIDTYKYIVRWPVMVNIPTQTGSWGGANWTWSAATFIEYAVPACANTCSLGTSPLGSITYSTVSGANNTNAYTAGIVGIDRNIYVIRKTEIPVCLRCQEEEYWCPSANACVNMGETCTNHQCNNDTICDINEGCGCWDCAGKQDHCAAGLTCTYVVSNPNNSSCDRVRCAQGTYFCPGTQTCIPQGTTCSDHKCNNNTVCDFNEGCGCRDCDGQEDHCADTLICRYNATNANNSSCVTTTCESGEYWCSATRACVANNLPCDGTCKSPLILHNNQCIPNGSCLPGNKCCPIGTYFCSSRSTCLAAGQTCTI